MWSTFILQMKGVCDITKVLNLMSFKYKRTDILQSTEQSVGIIAVGF